MVKRSKTFIVPQKQLLSAFCWLFILSSTGLCQGKPIFHWSFDDAKDISFSYGQRMPRVSTKEAVTGADFNVMGLAKYVPGVSGSAMKFDGFSSYVDGRAEPSRRRRSGDEDEDDRHDGQ